MHESYRVIRESWFDTHNQHHINYLKPFSHGFDGRCRLDRDADTRPTRAYQCNAAGRVGAGFEVERHHIGPRLSETLHIAFRLDDHQMHVKQLAGRIAHGFQHGKPERNVGDEHAVHHVDMHPLSRTAVEHANRAVKVTEIGRKYRRGNNASHFY